MFWQPFGVLSQQNGSSKRDHTTYSILNSNGVFAQYCSMKAAAFNTQMFAAKCRTHQSFLLAAKTYSVKQCARGRCNNDVTMQYFHIPRNRTLDFWSPWCILCRFSKIKNCKKKMLALYQSVKDTDLLVPKNPDFRENSVLVSTFI